VRGYPFLVLREAAGPGLAVALTSVVFGVLHLQNPGATVASVAVVTLAGVFLAGVLLATGSLWAAFTAHLAWNWTMSGLLHAAVSGLPFATPDYRVVDAGPDWLTGGAWGPEGGAGAAGGMLLALIYLRRRAQRGAGIPGPFESRPVGRGSE
jgi:membrane protease YdiL (CAAX protease family)